jgi:hypothetical protein
MVPVVGNVLDPDELEDVVGVGPALERALRTASGGVIDRDERSRDEGARREVAVVVDVRVVRLEGEQVTLVVLDRVRAARLVQVDL